MSASGSNFRKFAGHLERLGGLRFVANVLGGDDGAVLRLDSQREFAHRIDPAKEFRPRIRDRTVTDSATRADRLFTGAFAAPVALPRNASQFRHRLPLPAWIVRVDRHEHPGQPARLPGVHENPRGGPHEIGGRLCNVDQEEAVGEFRRFQTHLVIEYTQLPGGRRRRAFVHHDNEIRGKLLRACCGAYRQSTKPATASRPSHFGLNGQTIIEAFVIVKTHCKNKAAQGRRRKAAPTEAIRLDRRHLNEVRSRSYRDHQEITQCRAE